ncbi:Tfp pilus assembly protein FimT/FimU [Acaryochloris sp. 'Moss Beach']|uniref:pilus assembly FimT family protein n=1 Tax=Acaryochloris sp. 'Moss Beach' TaxID=2740837 RepID=UPI0021030923|nr:prepilin-type N-terminal cleavage/methylation domain-containing protein [Acaryochloris sp. 'Moss Beach']
MLPNNLRLPPWRLSPVSGFTLIEKMVIVAILGIVASISAPGVWGMLNRARLKQTVAEVRTALNETQREAIRGNKVCTVTLNFVDGKVTGSCLKTGDRNLASEISIATNLTNDGSSPLTSQKGRVIADSQIVQGVSNGVSPSLIALSDLAEQAERASNAGMVVQVISPCQPLNSGKCMQVAGDFVGDEDSPGTSKSGVSYDIPIRFGVLGNPDFSIVSNGNSPTDPSGKIVFFFPDDAQGTKRCIAISNTLGLTRVGTYTGEMTPLAITTTGRCIAEKWDQQ